MNDEHPPLKLKTVEEAVAFLKGDLPKDYLQRIADCVNDRQLVGLCHRSLGMWIRNNMGLWSGNPELLEDTGATHADDASGVILRKLWKELREELGGKKKEKVKLTPTQEIKAKIEKLNEELRVHQERCPHLDLTKKHGANTGNYDPSSDSYWITYYCPLCEKGWTEYND